MTALQEPTQGLGRLCAMCISGLNLANDTLQHAKKVVSDSPGLVDFAIGLVSSVFNLLDRQVMLFEEFK